VNVLTVDIAYNVRNCVYWQQKWTD